MDIAADLLQLIRSATDAHSSSLSESNLIDRLENVKRRLIVAAISPESAAIGVCHVTSQVVGFLVQHRPVSVQAASPTWQKRVFLVETAIASALMGIGDPKDVGLAPTQSAKSTFCSIFRRLLHRLYESSQSSQQAANVVTVMTKLCVLLTICWLSYDRVGKLTKAEELLVLCSEFCLEHEATQSEAKWPQFLLGMVNMVEKHDYDQALQSFQAVVERRSGLEDEDGVVFYWQAIAFSHKNLLDEAIAALDKCIRANYEPVACLSLQALVNVQARDFHAAALQLRRALEIDYTHSRSLFNYALLMERMGNSEAQQELLEHVLERDKDADCQAKECKHKQTKDVVDVAVTLFEDASVASLFPSRLTNVDAFVPSYHLALAAMDNHKWLESKKQFETFLGLGKLQKGSNDLLEAERDYVYVLLQCKRPSLALRKCEQYLLEHEGSNTTSVDNVEVALLMLHLYKADALLCLERVDECYEYLKQTIEPKIRGLMQRPSARNADVISEEMASCHSQLLNNLAVVMTCCSGVDAGLSVLRNGLEQYPNCLAIKFNTVLLLWRKGDKAAACSLWARARGWNLHDNASDQVSHNATATHLNAAISASQFQVSSISEHVQGKDDGEGGISAEQLVYVDTLIWSYWRKTLDSQLTESLLFVDFFESLDEH